MNPDSAFRRTHSVVVDRCRRWGQCAGACALCLSCRTTWPRHCTEMKMMMMMTVVSSLRTQIWAEHDDSDDGDMMMVTVMMVTVMMVPRCYIASRSTPTRCTGCGSSQVQHVHVIHAIHVIDVNHVTVVKVMAGVARVVAQCFTCISGVLHMHRPQGRSASHGRRQSLWRRSSASRTSLDPAAL